MLTFTALMACGAVCIEASGRLGMPAGVHRDLLSAWWLPVALLLPPVYALLAPIPLQFLLQQRVRATVVYRRVFGSAAIGLAGGAASLLFHGRSGGLAALTAEPGSPSWWPSAARCCSRWSTPRCRDRRAHRRARQPLAGGAVEPGDACCSTWSSSASASSSRSPARSARLLLVGAAAGDAAPAQPDPRPAQAAARTDPKTGLLNAAAWQREADTEIVRARRTGETLALLLVDIDHFKRVNDTYGHLIGDQVLRRRGRHLCSQFRDYDVVGRFGGEEFVVLLPRADVPRPAGSPNGCAPAWPRGWRSRPTTT